ncbi:MAG: allantoinase AllB [Verrucomicrobiota bacterium]
MPAFDLLIHSTTPDGSPVSLGITDGCIAALDSHLASTATKELTAPETTLYPGWIDAHVHFNEPGRTEWEGLASGSWALAKGGGTAFFDMPLNSSPPVLNRQLLEEKSALAGQKSCLDFALWGGLTPDSLDHLEDMAQAGAIGFKAFLCHSGLDEFPHADPQTLKVGMTTAAALNLPVSTHAEFNPTGPPPTGTDMRAWLDSRPIQLELDAIQLATDLAGETGCALHIVHVYCPEGIELISQAKSRGVNVTAETCPHYLLLDESSAIEIGAFAKCAPPLRNPERVAALWQDLRSGRIDTLGSDHSPSSPDLKTGDDLFAIWGGIAGIQHGLPLLLDQEPTLNEQISANVAQRFRLPNKGGLTIGHDADFFLTQKDSQPIAVEDLVTRHPISPYLNRTLSTQITATYLRGQLVTPETKGKLLKPEPA